MRKLTLLLAIMCSIGIMADTIEVKTVRHIGPFTVKDPVVLDSINNAQKKYSADLLLDTPLALDAVDKAADTNCNTLKLTKGTLNAVGFGIHASSYIKDAQLTISGTKKYKIYADGKEASETLTLQPGYHTLKVKFIADSAAIAISVNAENIYLHTDRKHPFSMTENLGTRVLTDVSLSPSGQWAIIEYRWYDEKNKLQEEAFLCNMKSGEKRELFTSATWMPNSDRYYYIEKMSGRRALKAANPLTGHIETLCTDMPEGYFEISPTEDFAILMSRTEGPQREDGVYELIHPDDRQPGWRNRTSLSRIDLKTGFAQPLTYSYRHVTIDDISPDGKYLLFSVSSDSLTQRPTTRSSYYVMNLSTLETKNIVEKDGFIASGIFAGSSERIAFYASTEAFNGIGKQLPEGRTPNMYDYHLYIMDTKTMKVTPVTADHKTSVEDIKYCAADGDLYYTALNGDSVSLYRLDMKTYESFRVAQPMEVLTAMSVARNASTILIGGSSACVPYEVYSITSPKKKPTVKKILSPNDDLYADVALGTVKPWSFRSSRGYDVTGFYFLPDGFDESKKYPLIVHYYGGCIPSERRFGNGAHYPAHLWNAHGYIVFIVNPSGAAGFGQEWASRHVNTMGEGPAQDIIDATRQFAKDIPQVDSARIGCVSASYGGFMTQYMLTKDNPFACGISHAGISSHTSYWGEGYWGYSYSEVAAANSYPWTRKDLYVDRSPLYNADKIKRPLLFTHGTDDTNVPVGESIQMYTALRLLGTPTAFIQIEGENHGITDPDKRTAWINSMTAWFDRWLKGDSTWWEAIYKPKKL